MRILLAEDDTMIGERLQRSLTKSGHAVDWLVDGDKVGKALDTQKYEMLLLDLALPGRSGLEILKVLRQQNNHLPVIILTAKDSVPERIAGLDAGADDYLVKPFALDELDARIRALQRRQQAIANPLLEFGRLSCNPAIREVRFDSAVVSLTGREYQILLMLMLHPGAIVSRREIEERLYNLDVDIDSNAIEVHIHKLRQKLDAAIIRTVRGLGYQLVEL